MTQSDTPVHKCPFCAELIQQDAVLCKHCHSDLSGSAATDKNGTFDVILVDSGKRKIELIKVIRELTGLGLKEAKDMVDAAPTVFQQELQQEAASQILIKLQSAGAVAEIQPFDINRRLSLRKAHASVNITINATGSPKNSLSSHSAHVSKAEPEQTQKAPMLLIGGGLILLALAYLVDKLHLFAH